MSAAEKWLRARPTDGPDVTWFRGAADDDSGWATLPLPLAPLTPERVMRLMGNPFRES